MVPVGGGGSWRWAACSDERAVRGLRGLVVVPVGGGGSWRWAACSDERAARGLRGLVVVPVGGGGAWPGFETTRRAKLVARTASGRAGLAPPGSEVAKLPPGSVVAKLPPGSVVAKMPRGSEVGRNSASGGVEVEEGD